MDDDIADMITDQLADHGADATYTRDGTDTNVTFLKLQQFPQTIEVGPGQYTEVRPTDFVCLSADFPYDVPVTGDIITSGGDTYRVMPTTGEMCYRIIVSTMLRVDTKKVS